MKYLWDTNIVIYYLQQQFTPLAEKFIDKIIKTEKPCISAITEIELLCWKTTNENDLITLQNFIKVCFVDVSTKLISRRSFDRVLCDML
ncbi:hypothetical protein EON73_05275 [bacterium]|nr:MAG: hypothetical protein EON73_05275 [bacterium]